VFCHIVTACGVLQCSTPISQNTEHHQSVM